jgi:hypothetical protein
VCLVIPLCSGRVSVGRELGLGERSGTVFSLAQCIVAVGSFRCCTVSILWCAMRGEYVGGAGSGNIRFGCGSEVGEVEGEWSLVLSSFVVWEDNKSRQQYCLSHALSRISVSSVRSNCRVDELRDLCWAQR